MGHVHPAAIGRCRPSGAVSDAGKSAPMFCKVHSSASTSQSLLFRLRELCAGLRHRHHLRAAVQGRSRQSTSVLLRPAASLAGVLDAMNQRAIIIRWILPSPSVSSLAQCWANTAPLSDPRVQAMSLADPKIFVALVCQNLSFCSTARRIKAAYLSAGRFAIVLRTS